MKNTYKEYYDPKKEDASYIAGDYFQEVDLKPWSIGHMNNKSLKDVKTISCVRCGGDKFEVGTGTYFTGVRCPNCKWEYCIHEG